MKYHYYIGIDLAKTTFDATLLKEGTVLEHQRVDNDSTNIRQWLRDIKSVHGAGGKTTLFCMEHTGPYKEPLLKALSKRKIGLWLESPLRINRSLGIQRGKSDRIDSLRIAQYAYLNREKFIQWESPREVIQELKSLSSLRLRLQRALLRLEQPLKESAGYAQKHFCKQVAEHCAGSIAALREDLSRTEETMQDIILWDEKLRHLYELITSVPGVGPVVATELIIATNEFKNFPSGRKFACYAGIAPFEHTSGTSVQGKTRVSKFANRHVKAILFMPALSTIRTKCEMADYFQRKVAEGHPKKSVLNAVKNKLIHRIFACIRDDRFYIKEPAWLKEVR